MVRRLRWTRQQSDTPETRKRRGIWCIIAGAHWGIDQSDAPRDSKLGSVSYEEWKAGKEQKNIDKSSKNGIINIGRSIGAKAKNYNIKLPNKEIVHLTEGTSVTHIQVIAGKGRNRQINEIDVLLSRYPGTQELE